MMEGHRLKQKGTFLTKQTEHNTREAKRGGVLMGREGEGGKLRSGKVLRPC